MVFKSRFLWIAYGPDYYRMRGFSFCVLLFPRPAETRDGEEVRAAVRLLVCWDGPDMIFRDRQSGIRSASWTGLEYYWPPSLSWRFG